MNRQRDLSPLPEPRALGPPTLMNGPHAEQYLDGPRELGLSDSRSSSSSRPPMFNDAKPDFPLRDISLPWMPIQPLQPVLPDRNERYLEPIYAPTHARPASENQANTIPTFDPNNNNRGWQGPPRMPSNDWLQYPGGANFGDIMKASRPPISRLRSGEDRHHTPQSWSLAGQGMNAHTPAEPLNFLHLLSPNSDPPYPLLVQRIINFSDQQASIFLQQKLKASSSDPGERAKIVDAICGKGFEMMCNRFGNWAVQRCLESSLSIHEKYQIVSCVRGRVIELATNCYGTHCLQKLLDCEEDIRLLVVSELLVGDPCRTLLNKHASHVWSKIMELRWTPPAPPFFEYINRSLSGKWPSLACHETGSLVVQHAFENLEASAKEDIVCELLRNETVFGEIVQNQWGSFCISHLLELGSPRHRAAALELLLSGLLDYATSEHGVKAVLKAIKEGDAEVLEKVVARLCQPARGGRRAIIIDLALSSTGSQLFSNILPNLSKEQRSQLYDAIRPFIVTLRGSKTGSKTIWLFDRMVSSAPVSS
ncbi:ARM repeat-containing protein [Sistotremastrum suecicum HHB10207 ss-3]|uniref:ARM repeat-containing protein n=1 Tax=Sistotremastrum suecicum HHB10207 ss-3 TaxID=1314776 RepID=A0A166HDN1_9AGAM|nr:ARM repeat-containing protein [Sistotremastrum suecicum HHB10207 ss-3]